MAEEHDTTREGTVEPGAEHPAGAPSVPAGEPEAPVGPATVTPDEGSPSEGSPSDGSPDEGSPDEGSPEARSSEGTSEPGSHNGGEPVDHHEKLLERDLEELTAKAEKADAYLELAKRTKADFENYRKRAAREAAAAQERGVAKLARELLPAVDNLERAVQAAEAGTDGDDGGVDGSASTLVSGIKLVHADVLAALQRAGIERYSPEGEPFDPQRHEAVAQTPVEGAQPGTIVEVYQRGYLLGDAVIRPARVVVAG